MDQEEIKLLIQAGLRKRPSRPLIQYPEHTDLKFLSTIFQVSYLLWLPETNIPGGKPICISSACGCVPRIKEYKCREVEDMNHKTLLLFVKYECNGVEKKSFTTIDDEYFKVNKKDALVFPYILSGQSGISKDTFNLIHDGVMSARGKAYMITLYRILILTMYLFGKV